jgi:hypothetical protein
MINRTRTQITIQTRQTIVVRPLRDAFHAWCEQCLAVVLALTQESASGLLQVPIGTLYELLAGGKLHAVEAGARSPLICCNSLSAGSTQNTVLIEGERQ